MPDDRDSFDFSHLEPEETRRRRSVPPPNMPDRRRKKDWVLRAVPVLGGAGWLFAFLTIIFMGLAYPASADFFTRVFKVVVYSTWNTRLVTAAFVTLVAALALCITGIAFNMLRHKRITDRYNASIIALAVFLTVVLVIFIAYFLPYL